MTLVVESITDGFAVIDREWRLTYMNRGAEELNRRNLPPGVRPSEAGIFPLTISERGRTKIKQSAAERRTIELEEFHAPWQRWFEFKASPTNNGGFAVYFRDITERKRTEEEMRRLASIIESSEDAVIGMDLEATITSWNPAAERLFGYASEEVIGRTVSMLIPPDHQDEEPALVEKIRRGESTRHFDTVRMTKEGRLLDVSLSVSPIKDGRGRIVGCSKIARDISDRKAVEAALREADRRKDDFLALLGHELRNPLAAIVSGAQVLKEIGSHNAEACEVQALIERQAGHMSRLIDDLLDVSRIVRGKITLHRQPTDLVAILRQIVDDYRSLIRQRGITLDLGAPDAVFVDGDPTRLAQILGNLLDNAVKFTDRGGAVHVLVRHEPLAQEVVVEVRDSGIGMTPRAMASLFEPFARPRAR